MPEPHSDHQTSSDPLDQIDPLVLLLDARRQLVAAVEALDGAEPERVATALGIVVAHDHALRDVALAHAEGDRTFEGVPSPADRAAGATIEEAHASRAALFETLAATGVMFDLEVLVPWAGMETWHVHLIGLAMQEGAQAHALREGEPLPLPLDR